MATATKTVKRTTTRAKRGANGGRRTATTRRAKSPSRLVNILVPLVFMAAILICLGFLLTMGYRTVTASSFFDAKTIDVKGNSRVAKNEIERIVRGAVERNGVWNAELEQIKAALEKMPYVKSAVVSRVLPNGIVVRVEERIPRAVVRLNSDDFWVDDEAMILGAVGKTETRPDFVLRGWDETRSEKAQKENQNRVQLYQKIKSGWDDAGIAKRVTALDLTDAHDVQALIAEAGANVSVALGKEDFSRRLQKALEVIESEDKPVESIISRGGNVIAKYRND